MVLAGCKEEPRRIAVSEQSANLQVTRDSAKKMLEYSVPTFTEGKALWFSHMNHPMPDSLGLRDGQFCGFESNDWVMVDGSSIKFIDGLYGYDTEYVQDPRLTDWWLRHFDVDFYSIEQAVEFCSSTKGHPSVTSQIIKHMAIIGEYDSTAAVDVGEVMRRYTEPALFYRAEERLREALRSFHRQYPGIVVIDTLP